MGSVTEQSVMGVIRAARPSFRNSHDKVAFAVHASFPASGFLLQATGPPAFSDDVLSSTSAAEVGVERWNEFDDSYAFVYSNPDKDSQRILVKCLAMNDKLLVDALREANSEPVHLEIKYIRKAELESEMIPRPAKLAPDFRNLMNQVQVLLFLLFLWWGRWSLSWASGWSLPKGQFWWTWQHPYRPK